MQFSRIGSFNFGFSVANLMVLWDPSALTI